VARLFVGAGRVDGARPQDLVGAITGESHLHGSDIGAIRIFDRFAIVEVPEADADDVISAMRGTTIRGRKAPVRRDRAQP
jgi:ATP-dependent RNA helicase DeaD